MTLVTIAIVAVGVALVAAIGATGGFDATSIVYLLLIIALGSFAIAVARKAGRDAAGPRACHKCGGLISPNAPTCKHCGTPQVQPRR